MPRWTREPNSDQRIKLAITGFKNSLYKSREDAAKSYGVNPNTLRRRLNGKHKSHKVAHTHRQRLLPPAESAVVRQCISAVSSSAAGVKEGIESFGDCV